jgi:hypothetical protein
MHIHSTGEVSHSNLTGKFPGYRTVWYHEGGIAIILSLSQVQDQGYTVMYSNEKGNEFIVLKKMAQNVFSSSPKEDFFI